MHPAVALGISYLAGSIPSAYLAGRMLKGIDLRTVGSGNLGATNVFRNLGARAAAVVLAVDALKGALPVAILPRLVEGDWNLVASAQLTGIACGVAAIAGHAKPIFLLGKGGGKGVATAAGVFAALAPHALAMAFLIFAAVMWRTRIVSAASISSAAALPIAVAVTLGIASPVFAISCAISLFVIWSHRANIERLRAGTEPRLARAPKEGTR